MTFVDLGNLEKGTVMSDTPEKSLAIPDNMRSALSLPFEDMSKATDGAKKAYQDLLNLGDNTFGQSKFSESRYVLSACLLPHRTHRQAAMHLDSKRHSLAEAQAGKAKALAKIKKVEGDLHILEKLRAKIEKMSERPLSLPLYKCEMVEHETVSHVEFNPVQIMEFYEESEWLECQGHLISELDTIIVVKRAELSQIRRGQFQQEKLEKDAVSDIEWYEREIIPKTAAAAQASLDNGITFELEESRYWTLRNERFIECKLMEQATGIPHDYWESISQLPDTMSSNLIEFAKEQKRLMVASGTQFPMGSGNGEVPNSFRYKKHTAETVMALTAGKSEDAKLLTTKSQAERTTLGGICMGLLYRNKEEADQKGACDPEGMIFTPRGYDLKPLTTWGMRTDEARNFVVQKALEGGANWVFFVDDDMILPKMALRDLLEIATTNDWAIVGGDYPLKKNPYESASLVYVNIDTKGAAISPAVEVDNKYCIVPAAYDSQLVEDFDFQGEKRQAIKVNGILATGCMLIRADVLRKMGGDWFREYRKELAPGVTEMIRTDDAPFTTRAVELGFTPRLIPSIKCQHVDFKNKRVYGSKTEGVDYCVNHRANPFLIANSGKANPKAVVYVPRRAVSHIPFVDLNAMSRPKCIGLAIADAPVGVPWAEAWTHMARQALGNEADYLVLIEDDMVVPRNAVAQLIHRMQETDYAFICGSYVRKDMTNESAHISVEGSRRIIIPAAEGQQPQAAEVPNEIPFPNPFEERGLIENNHVVCFGCSIIRTRVFADLPAPWFHFVPAGSQIAYYGQKTDINQTITHDAFFTRRLFGCGYKSAVDTDLQCLHVEPTTGRVYGSPKFVSKDYELMLPEADRFAINQETLKRMRVRM
jgi:GT2 family glycosyltransferase